MGALSYALVAPATASGTLASHKSLIVPWSPASSMGKLFLLGMFIACVNVGPSSIALIYIIPSITVCIFCFLRKRMQLCKYVLSFCIRNDHRNQETSKFSFQVPTHHFFFFYFHNSFHLFCWQLNFFREKVFKNRNLLYLRYFNTKVASSVRMMC